jgi:hypothetical protein
MYTGSVEQRSKWMSELWGVGITSQLTQIHMHANHDITPTEHMAPPQPVWAATCLQQLMQIAENIFGCQEAASLTANINCADPPLVLVAMNGPARKPKRRER